MTRRDLLVLGAGAGVLGVVGVARSSVEQPLMRPKRLGQGAKVALVSPAGDNSDPEALEKASARVRGWGWEPVMGRHAGGRFAYFGGTDAERAADLVWALEDDSIDGVVCIRGGWGCARILDRLDFDALKAKPKVLLGYSDITALLVAFHQACGWVTFHGPVAASSDSEFSDHCLRRVVGETGAAGLLLGPETEDPDFEFRTVAAGRGEGVLTGGNLAILSSLCGTPWQVKGEGAVVFLEDVGEAPYRIDRMLTQMLSAGCFRGCMGVLVGQFTRCDSEAPESPWKVADVVADRLGGLGVPVLAGCPIGHVKEKWTLPLGCRVRVDADARSVEVLDGAVV